MAKFYKCELPNCDREVNIRSSIKSGEFKGLKACGYCKNKFDKKVKPMIVSKSITERKQSRECLTSFFRRAIVKLKSKPICENCGVKINTNFATFNNIAHILPKRKYKSIMCNDNNYLILCDSKDNSNGHSCHTKFDSGFSNAMKMDVFKIAIERFNLFKDEVEEMGNDFIIFDSYEK